MQRFGYKWFSFGVQFGIADARVDFFEESEQNQASSEYISKCMSTPVQRASSALVNVEDFIGRIWGEIHQSRRILYTGRRSAPDTDQPEDQKLSKKSMKAVCGHNYHVIS